MSQSAKRQHEDWNPLDLCKSQKQGCVCNPRTDKEGEGDAQGSLTSPSGQYVSSGFSSKLSKKLKQKAGEEDN